MSGKVNDNELKESLNEVRKDIKDEIKAYIDNFPSDENWKLWREQKRRHLSMLFSLAKEFRESYRILKENNKAMDFNDMEKYFLNRRALYVPRQRSSAAARNQRRPERDRFDPCAGISGG